MRFGEEDHRNKRRMEDRDWDGRRGPFQGLQEGYYDDGRRGQYQGGRTDYNEGARREAAPPPRSGGSQSGQKIPSEKELLEERRTREKLLKAAETPGSSEIILDAKKKKQDPSDASKKRLPYCHKCTKTGHVQRECTAPPTCYTCKKAGHVATECVEGRTQPKLRICGAGDKMFYIMRLEIDESVCAPTTVTGILRVMEGICDGDLVLLELTHLFEQDWPWRIKPLGPGDYLIEFPDKAIRREVTKFTNGFNFVCDNSVKAKVSDSIREFDAFGMLDETWARIYGLPDWARKEEAVWELCFIVGEPREVDVDSLPGVRPVRTKIACKDKTQVDGYYNVYINGRGFRLEWEVESNSASSSSSSSDLPPDSKKDDGEENKDNDQTKQNEQQKDKNSKEGGGAKEKETEHGSSPSHYSGGSKHKKHDVKYDLAEEDMENDLLMNPVGSNSQETASPTKRLTFYNEKVEIPERLESDEDDVASPIDATPVAMSFPPGKPQWDGKTEWYLVSHHAKKKEVEMKCKGPAQAQRQSDRLMGKLDGLPIQKRAEIRASKKNDITVDSVVVGKA